MKRSASFELPNKTKKFKPDPQSVDDLDTGYSRETMYALLQSDLENAVKLQPIQSLKGGILEQQVLALLKSKGWFVIDLNVHRKNAAGIDLIAFSGRVVRLIQCKNYTGTAINVTERKLLKAFLNNFIGASAGCLAFTHWLQHQALSNTQAAVEFANEIAALPGDIQDPLVQNWIGIHVAAVDIVSPDGLVNGIDDGLYQEP